MAKKNKKSSFNKNLYNNSQNKPERKKGPIDKLAYIVYCVSAIIFAFTSMSYFQAQNTNKGMLYLVLLMLSLYLIYVYRNKKD